MQDLIDEREKKKERIMLLSLQRRQQQEEAKERKQQEMQARREKEKEKEEERARKKEEQAARRAAILEQHRLKKAIEEAEKEVSVLNCGMSVKFNHFLFEELSQNHIYINIIYKLLVDYHNVTFLHVYYKDEFIYLLANWLLVNDFFSS